MLRMGRRWLRKAYLRAHALRRADETRRRELSAEMRSGAARHVQVVNLHGTAARDARAFRRQIAWLKDHFQVLDFAAFQAWWDPVLPLPDPRPGALLTFDDGFASNYHVAAPLLEEAGLRGVFFVNPGFCAYDRTTAERVLAPLARPRGRKVTEEDWLLMTPEQIADLGHRGHTIGNHTLTHANLRLTPAAELRRQIVESAERLAAWCGRPVEAFAWTFTWDAIQPRAWDLILGSHRWCFAACPGVTNTLMDSPGLIWRTNVEAWFPAYEYRFVYSGLVDRRTAGMRDGLRRMLPSGERRGSLPAAERTTGRISG